MASSFLKFLIDTNIFIPLEPTAIGEVEAGTIPATTFFRRAQETGCRVFIHPESLVDVSRDQNAERRRLRELQFGKYPRLPDPPPVRLVEPVLGVVEKDDHDWVDNHLLAALVGSAADWVVSEDRGIHTRAKELQLADRVLHLADAICVLEDLAGRVPTAPPAVVPCKAHALDERDPIFASLRADYVGFDGWLQKAKRAHRQSWVIKRASKYCAVTLVKEEDPPEFGLEGKVLKLCTFKVAEDSGGLRLGELLLKTVFQYSIENRYDWICVTVLPKHVRLLEFFSDFGFEELDVQTSLGEMVLAKPMHPPDETAPALSPIDFHRRYGPWTVRFSDAPVFAVPIRPQYHRLLFPECCGFRKFCRGNSGNSGRLI